MAKKLKVEDIPEGYNYAAMDSDGCAYAFKSRPILDEDGGIWKCSKETEGVRRIAWFEPSDWKNSLISRETDQPETAYKETANKLSYSEIDPYFLEQMARRMQKGKEKYGPNNWKKLSDINELLDAAQRHLLELRKMVEEDFEPLPGQESEAQHCAALACNAMFIHYHLNPNS